VDLGEGAVGRQTTDNGRCRDQGVVGAQRLGGMARLAVDAQPAPAAALLPDHHGQAPATRAVEWDATGLGDEVVALDGVGLVLGEPAGAVGAEGLLVGDSGKDERSFRPEAAAGEAVEGHRHRRRDVEHVDGTAAPHLALDELAAEGVARPRVGIRRHDIGVTEPAERRRRRVGALDAADQRGPAWRRLVHLEVDA
jgi:hypothetical protein